MKRSLILITLFVLLTPVYGQKSIDALFRKYSGKDGYVTVSISGNLLKLSSCFNSDNENDNSMPSDISEIRIIAQEDRSIKSPDFFDIIIGGIDLDEYEEFVRVSKPDQDLRMLVRAEGNSFREFLLIAGGEDNALIQIKGKMTYSEARKISKEFKKTNSMNTGMNSR